MPASAKTVVLHIGLPKTATTLIQNTLCAAPDALTGLGLAYMQAGSTIFGDRGHHILVQATLGAERGKRIRANTSAAQYAEAWPNALAEIAASPARQIFVSSELFSFALMRDEDIQAVRDQLAAYDVRVVLVLRDVADFVDSVYAQRLKGGFSGTPGEFISRNWVNLNWQGLYDRWARVFSEQAMVALDFGALRKGNLVDNFVRDAFRVDVPDGTFTAGLANPALPYYAARMLCEINGSDIPPDVRTAFRIQIRDFFDEHGRSGTFKKAKFLDEDTRIMLRHYCTWPPLGGAAS